MLCDYVCLVYLLVLMLVVCLVSCVFVLLFVCFYQSFFCVLCQKSKYHIKSRISKCLIDFVEFCIKTRFALYLCTNGFVHFRALLVFMHLYLCGKNLEIYVIVVNRSSNLSWMISEWLCWSWDMHRLVSISLPIFYFMFC